MTNSRRSDSAGDDELFTSRRWVVVAILALAALVAYANTFRVPLLLDDSVTIRDNPSFRHVWPLTDLFSPPNGTGVSGRPVANLVFALNHWLTGDSLAGYHAVNLAIHIMAALLLFGLVRRTLLLPKWGGRFGRDAGALGFLAALLWELHPIQTESVTYISQRTEELMGLFYFLVFYAAIRAASSPRAVRWWTVAVMACFAGMATKEVMVTAPVLLFLFDSTFLARSFRQALRQRWLVYAALTTSWLLLAVLMAGLHTRGVGYGFGVSWWKNLQIEADVVTCYLGLIAWPHPLVFDYGFEHATTRLGVVVAIAVLALLAVVAWLGFRRGVATVFLIAWFLIVLAPTSSFVPIPLQPMAENRIYLPLAAGAVGFVLLAYAVLGDIRRTLACGGMLAVAFGSLAAARNHDYRTDIALWSDTVAKRPQSARAHNNLGDAMRDAGRYAAAKAEFERAIALRPAYADAHANLGSALGSLGNTDGAISECRRALAIEPGNADALCNLGAALGQKQQFADALAAYDAALRLRPGFAEVRVNIAGVYLALGRPAEAIAQCEMALAQRPNLTTARYSLACGLAQTGRVPDAIALFQRVVRERPDFAEAFYNLGTLLHQSGRIADAIPNYESALRLKPRYAEAHSNLASALLSEGDVSTALKHYQEAIDIVPDYADAHSGFGSALLQCGRTDEALQQFEITLRLNPNSAAARSELARLRSRLTPSRD